MDSNTSFATLQSFSTILWQSLPQQFSLMKAECSCGQRKTTGGWKSNGAVISCLIWLTLIIGWSIHDKLYSPIVRFQSDPEVLGVYKIIFALIILRFLFLWSQEWKGFVLCQRSHNCTMDELSRQAALFFLGKSDTGALELFTITLTSLLSAVARHFMMYFTLHDLLYDEII